MALSKVIYVYEDKDNDGSTYLVASLAPGDQDEGLVGVYDLRETLFVRHPLEFRRPGTKQWFKSSHKHK
jgi:hypothetical protein